MRKALQTAAAVVFLIPMAANLPMAQASVTAAKCIGRTEQGWEGTLNQGLGAHASDSRGTRRAAAGGAPG